jgi:FemAB-related protein (PEP-CTERM system-associated)
LIEKIYGLEHFWYVARKNGKIDGFLGLALSNHPIFGKYLVSAPFASQGGFYADSEDAYLALIEKAGELQDQIRARYTLIRHMNPKWDLPAGWQNDHSYATYQLNLEKDFESFSMENIRGTLRNTIKKFDKHELGIMFGGFELIEDFWKAISRSMKELGSPYHSKHYLEALKECMGSKAEFVLSKDGSGRIIGGGLLISHQDKMETLHMNALKEYQSMNVADFLYWSTIQECYRRKVCSIDMGRSLVGSGNEKYKMKWRPIRNVLYYSYRLTPEMKTPSLNQRNPRLKFAINVWQRMPLVVANFLGPRLISGIL